MNKLVSIPPRKPRISEKIRKAVQLMAKNGLSQVAAAEVAGLSRQGLGKAMKRPEVADLLQEARLTLVAEAAHLRETGRVLALQAAIQMLETSQDEKTKVRLIEFLAGDGKTAPIAINIDNRTETPPVTGYRYKRPMDLSSEGSA